MPAISVIIPVYNMGPWLRDCLESVLAQTFTSFECILVDDGSTDDSPQICDHYAKKDDRFRVIHKANGGLSSARNAGLDDAAGEYIAFVDSDDVILPDYLKVLYEALHQNDADMSICGVEDVTESCQSLPNPALTQPIKEGCFGGDELLYEFYGPSSTYYTVAWNKLYSARLWENLRYPNGLIHEDDAVAHRLFHESRAVACVARPLYRYRLRSGSICRTGFSPARFDGVTALVMRCRYLSQNQLPKDLQSKALAACWCRYLSLCAQARQTLTPAVYDRWHAEQMRMCTLLAPLPACRELSLREKASCLLWSARPLPHTHTKKGKE